MEWVCGVFSSSAAAAWVQAGGTAGAAVIAVIVYAFTKSDAERVLERKRKFIFTTLSKTVQKIVKKATNTKAKMELIISEDTNGCTRWASSAGRSGIIARDLNRVLEMEGLVFSVAQDGDECIAEFMVTCREAITREKSLSESRKEIEARMHVDEFVRLLSSLIGEGEAVLKRVQ